MEFRDKHIICLCGQAFTWTPGEQRFLQGLVDDGKKNSDGSPVVFRDPKRCVDCRRAKREKNNQRG